MAQVHKRSIRNYLLDTGYQLRFTAVIVIIAAVLTGGLGYLVMHYVHEASRVIDVRLMGDPNDVDAQMLASQFARGDRMLMVVLVSFGVVLSAVLFAYGIVMTHKVAGPIYKITSYLDKIRDGKLGQVYNLRKGDQLVDFFEHFKNAHDALRRGAQEDVALLDKAIAAVGKAPVADELAAMKQRKEDSLK
jgi:hypothetical protein